MAGGILRKPRTPNPTDSTIESAKGEPTMTNPVETPNAVHGCIIMASGLSTRFGSNKLMANLDGAPLIAHAR